MCIEEWRYSSTHSLTSALDGDEWSASRLGRFTPRERAPGTHWIGGWVDPRAGLDAVVKRNVPSFCRDSNPRSSSPSPAQYHLPKFTAKRMPGSHVSLVWRNKTSPQFRPVEGKTLLGRNRHRWEDNIRMNLREIGWEDADWVYLAYDRHQWRALVNMVMKFRVP
jgi:hypothetical protein